MDLMNPETVTVTRPTKTRDSVNGWTVGTPAAVWTGLVDFYVPRRVSEKRDEADPGVATEKIRNFMFPVQADGSLVDVRAQDIISRQIGSEVYTARFVWEYPGECLQVEGWVMK